jgi:NAD(P)H-hydrate epimerase
MKIPIEEILNINDVNSTLRELNNYNILVDALFGTGLAGEVREPFKTLIQGVNNLNKTVVSVDIPSGLDCNTGKILGVAIKATKTVTFAASKKGFYSEDGPHYTGEVLVTDISIPKHLLI